MNSELDEDAMLEASRAREREFDPISIEEVSDQFGPTVRTLRRWQAKGRMPKRRRYGHSLKYSRRDIEALFEVLGQRRGRKDGKS
jgi:hypothetical protein